MRSIYNAAPIPHDEPTTHPKQLFAAGVASCFESALRLAARLQKKPLKEAQVTAHTTLDVTGDEQFVLGIELHGHLDGFSSDEAQALMDAALRTLRLVILREPATSLVDALAAATMSS